ncbi:hypothetical protein PENSPDRAFT_752619 [Peniophora sp. CONT]|nr:hypothetical protein PENSPDRAFT_752619 [Peniophora sp. CONT]
MMLDLPQNRDASVEQYWEHAFQPRVKFYDALVDQNRGTTTSRDSLEIVEKELRALQAQSAQFYTRVNAFRPISRLSPELLSLVFHYLSLIEPAVPAGPELLEEREFRRNLAPTKTWIKVTHVCSTFRQCALGDRLLWRTTTTAFGPEWMKLLVERSQAPPQSVHVGTGAPMLSELRSLLQQAHAVQITHLRPGDSLSKSTISLPEVRSLRIHMTDGYPDHHWDTFNPVNTMPHLTDLHVHGLIDFDTTFPCITGGLVSLYIGNQSEPVQHAVNDVLDALTRLPRLEDLTLTDCDLWADDDTSSRSISAPALKHLLVESETFADVAKLFDAIEFSAGVSVHLAGDAPYIASEADGWRSLEHALSKPVWADLHTLELMGIPEDQPEMLRTVQTEDEGSLLFSAWREDEPGYVCVTGQPTNDYNIQLRLGTTQELRPKPAFSVQLTNYIGGRNQDNALGKAVTYFRAATELRTLSLRPGLTMDIKLPWPDVFSQYPHLTAIRVDHEDDFNHLFEALYFAQEPLPVRELRTISWPYVSDGTHYWNEHVNWTNPENKKKKKRGERGALLANVLLQRAAADAPLTSICLDQSQLQSEELWASLAKGAKGHPEFSQEARGIFKPVTVWNWDDWGRGL